MNLLHLPLGTWRGLPVRLLVERDGEGDVFQLVAIRPDGEVLTIAGDPGVGWEWLDGAAVLDDAEQAVVARACAAAI